MESQDLQQTLKQLKLIGVKFFNQFSEFMILNILGYVEIEISGEELEKIAFLKKKGCL